MRVNHPEASARGGWRRRWPGRPGGVAGPGTRGFTLIEILIVGALIVLFSGLAIINMQRFFDDAARKATFGEARSLATTLSFTHDHLGYYPRIYTLGKPLTLVTFSIGNQTVLRPGFDTYGYFPFNTTAVNGVVKSWDGPYAGLTHNRSSQNMLVKMRLTDASTLGFPDQIAGEDLKVVLWPADKWRNPWMVYAVVSDPLVATPENPKGLRLINNPSEDATFMNAVVNYGVNHIPGGNELTFERAPAYAAAVLQPAMLYVPFDVVPGGDADFSLKSVTSIFLPTRIDPDEFNPLLAQSIASLSANEFEAGITDVGSDDIYIEF
jgi:hypothetical protein